MYSGDTMSLLCCLIMSVVVLGSSKTIRHTLVIPTAPSSEQASSCPDNSRCLTLYELITGTPKGKSAFQSWEEVIFQSGVHFVNGTERQKLSVSSITGLTIRGEPNATIYCLNGFYFEFQNCSDVNVSSIKFQNCIGHSMGNHTLHFNKQLGNIVLDQIQFTNKVGGGVAIFIWGRKNKDVQVHLSNSKISTAKPGVYIHQLYYYKSPTFNVYISNTIFDGSCLKFQGRKRPYSKPYKLLLNNVSIINSNFCTTLDIRGTLHQKIDTVLQDVMILENRSPCLVHATNALITCTGYNLFQGNEGVIDLNQSELRFSQTNINFTNNSISRSDGAPIVAKKSVIVFENCFVRFTNNHGTWCGGIRAESNSKLIYKHNSNVSFNSGSGKEGGALTLYDRSVITLKPSNCTRVSFQQNKAKRGGAIFVEDSGYLNDNHELMMSVFEHQYNGSNIVLQFSENQAHIGGDDIYGGWVDLSVSENGEITYNPNISSILHSKPNGIASDPVRVCLCSNGNVDCNKTDHEMVIFGNYFNLDIVAVGQRYTPVVEFVEAKVVDSSTSPSGTMISEKYKVQPTQKICTTLPYTIVSSDSSTEEFEGTVVINPLKRESSPKFSSKQLKQLSEYYDYEHLFKQLSIKLKVSSCPLGFTLHNQNLTCICLPSIKSLGLQCDFTDHKIRRGKRQWVGVNNFNSSLSWDPGVTVHKHCPYDYCRTDTESLSISLEHPDEQCASNRAGILCGGCKTNFSRLLGSSKCQKCNDHKILFVIVPSFLLSGLILVFLLILLNLTVSVGTINGLIFYTNIIRAQHTTFFIANTSNSFLSMFIAWTNLDQGLESCLYNGLDDYTITWFQFLFPLYIWLIAAVLIVSSHYSTFVSKLVGRNAVPVLATLFLISYTKVLRLIIDVFSFTTITYSDGYKKTVWLIDGNVEFLKGKHIPLFLVTVLFVLVSLPYTFVLLTIQWLYKISQYRAMSWVQKLKPFFDAYTGPYKANHRYWTGLLLTARIVLLMTFSLNTDNNLSINLIAIITTSVVLLGWMSAANLVYERSMNNILETLFLTNITITSTAISFNSANEIESPVAIYLSTGLTLTVFIAIVLYRIQKQLLLTRCGSNLKVKVLTALTLGNRLRELEEEGYDFQTERDRGSPSIRLHQTTSTVMKSVDQLNTAYNSYLLKEPLLENCS